MSVTSPPRVVNAVIIAAIASQVSPINPSSLSLDPLEAETCSIAARINRGQHRTPLARVQVVDESAYNNGYDSDGCRGPFTDGVFGEERETYSESEIGDNPAPQEEAELRPISWRTEGEIILIPPEDIKKLEVVELQEELKAFGISQQGNKSQLVERLQKAIEEQRPYLAQEELDDPDQPNLISAGLPTFFLTFKTLLSINHRFKRSF